MSDEALILIRADAAILDANTHAMTAFRAGGNAVDLTINTTGGCTSLTFTAETSAYESSGYGNVIDRNSVWNMVVTPPHVAGSWVVNMEGLTVAPGRWVRISYKAGAAAGNLEVFAHNWNDIRSGSTSVSIGDVVADLDTTNTNTGNTASSVSSIDGKVTACNTGAIAGSVTANAGTNLNTSALATESTLSTFSGKVTVCNTGAVAGSVTANAGTNLNTSALATESTLSTLSGKVTACNTGAVVISSGAVTATSVFTAAKFKATGSGAVTFSTGAFASTFLLSHISLKLSAAGTTSENFVITLNAVDGAEYDVPLLSTDLSVGSVTSVILKPNFDDIPEEYYAGDSIDFTWPNTETRVYGIRVVGRLV